MTPEELRGRTKLFAKQVLMFLRTLPSTDEARILGRQLLRSSTSVAANNRAAGRARTKAEFLAKLGVVVEEADESMLWLELMKEVGIGESKELSRLQEEADQLVRIFVASRDTARRRRS